MQPVSTTIVIPTHNRVQTLSRAIDSALDQTIDDIEIIVVDDGSTDGTEELIRSSYSNSVKYIRYENNTGANFARTVGSLAAAGEYISFLDSDDELHPEHVQLVCRTLQNAPDKCAGVVVSNTVIRNEKPQVRQVRQGDISSDAILDGAVLNGFSSLTLRAEKLRKFLPLDMELPSAQETDLYLQLATRGQYLKGMKKSLVTYHENNEQISENIDRRIRGQERILKKHSSAISDNYRANYYYNLAFLYYKNEQMEECKHALKNVISYDPSFKHYYHYVASILGSDMFALSIKLKKILKQLIN